MNKEILRYCFEKGVLLDKEILGLFSEANDLDSIKLIIKKIKNYSQQKIITKSIFNNNDKIVEVFSRIPLQNQKTVEKLKIKLGLNIEIPKEVSIKKEFVENLNFSCVKIPQLSLFTNKKLEVKDFITYFRNRLSEMKFFLQDHSELDNLVSINKLSGNAHGISIIGLVYDKRVTKNKNIILELEDLTGKIKVLINKDKEELFKKAEEIALDSVIGVKGSGNSDIIFSNELIFPDSKLSERKKSIYDENVLFIGDLHFGSKYFLKENFEKFINYLSEENSNNSEAMKIKYLFIVGDIVTGVGNYPNQEKDLVIVDLEEQFLNLAEFLGKIRKDIKIIISPGNHDGVRLMEPQPVFDKKFAWPLYELENVFLTENPSYTKIGFGKDFPGFDILTYHGFSLPYYSNNVPRLLINRAMNNPEEIVKYLLMNRHLAPTHSSVQYFPLEKDPLIIKKIPDIFVTAHTHKSATCYYNNILIVSTSCWEAMTPYQEKFGNIPDHCKVPMFNLKNRSVKILDFE
jgi:DNA polymerase II small subunit